MAETETSEAVALRIIELMEGVKVAMESLRANSGIHGNGNGWDGRALSVALTELETAQLWLANARPE